MAILDFILDPIRIPLYRKAVFGIARTLLAALAGRGLMAQSDVENYASAIALLAVGCWSVYNKWAQHKALPSAPHP